MPERLFENDARFAQNRSNIIDRRTICSEIALAVMVTNLARFLCTKTNNHITGQALNINGYTETL